MASLSLRNIQKYYQPGNVHVVKGFNLEIQDGEFIVFVGPSGCGKSTTLRMIAGLEDISSGELYIDDELVNDVDSGKRHISMVFQSYALYPHMSVYDNMSFALKIQKVPKAEIEKRIAPVAELLGLTPFLKRKPKALSGGQRQRVALGRAIVRDDTKVLLMDEPLSNLDAKLRVQMRSEIIKLHQRIQTTIIYVTHDQIEAMTMADRIVIMYQGITQQVGTPKQVYDYPENLFVASFIGTPGMNFIDGTIDSEGFFHIDKNISLKLEDKQFELIKQRGYIDQEVTLGIRPEDVILTNEKKPNTLAVEVDIAELLGAEYNIIFNLKEKALISKCKASIDLKAHQKILLNFDMKKAHIFDPKTTTRIYQKEIN
ncbi:MAG: sn-glycerol-3-phosphate ABC transporter ATP-binding protein UgpC [Acholeplasmatales bacterium]|jgi:multiple sugar transport system ATP-binding protein|nr:sn-glycerol-3-phosphate ABC transporter ATP-binding protein UgpC [Acholeplasmatales bacterium]